MIFVKPACNSDVIPNLTLTLVQMLNIQRLRSLDMDFLLGVQTELIWVDFNS